MTAPVPVDVLIASYNTRDILRDCLRSLDEHRPPADRIELRVSVFDNASADGSAEMVAAEFPAVRLVRSEENVGFARANNALALSSTATYLMLLNSDTLLRDDAVTPLLAALEADDAIALVGPRLVYPDGRVQDSSEWFPDLRYEVALHLRGTKADRLLQPVLDLGGTLRRVRQLDETDEETTRDTAFLWATCWLIRRREVEESGLFDETFVIYDEDLDCCRRLVSRGRRIVYVPSVTIVHIGGSSSTSDHKRHLMHLGRTRYYRRHHGRATVAAYRTLVWTVARLKRSRAR